MPEVWKKHTFETFKDIAIEHAVRIEEKGEKVYTLHMSRFYLYKRELLELLEKLKCEIRFNQLLDIMVIKETSKVQLFRDFR